MFHISVAEQELDYQAGLCADYLSEYYASERYVCPICLAVAWGDYPHNPAECLQDHMAIAARETGELEEKIDRVWMNVGIVSCIRLKLKMRIVHSK